ncbi:flavin reductase [Candidatus Aerophobetes bacterium]|nr:flavin reductase [Candidatus Aerophobetes bacterium]
MNFKIFHKITYGLYVVASKDGEKINGQIANTVFQVTSEPPKVAVSINKENLTCSFIEKSGIFSVSILSEKTPLRFIGLFGFKSGREVDKFAQVRYKIGITGAPFVLENSIGYLEAEVTQVFDVGTHKIFVGKVVEAEILKDEEPLTYAYYHQVKRGVAPRTAPTYMKEEKKEVRMEKYKCTVCGYIYDPEKGDPDSGVKPGTPFEKLPESWVCPVCGAGKDMFEKES